MRHLIRNTATSKSPWASALACLFLLLASESSRSWADFSAPQARFVLSWGQKGDKPGEFFSPISLAFNKQDELFVTDLNNARVQKFTTGGRFLSSFDLPSDTPPRKSCIIGGMAIDDKGLIYLSFMVQNKIAVYDETGKLVRDWGKKGGADGEFWQPGGIVIVGNQLYVADQCNHRVQRFTLDGKYLAKWGAHGSAPGQFGGPELVGSRFAGPHFLARDSHGRFYTTEGVLGRVQQLTQEGKPICAWGTKGDEPGGFGSYKMGTMTQTFGPIGVMVDRQDRVWVSSLNDRVQCFSPDGTLLMSIQSSGAGLGKLARPHGMVVDSNGDLYIADAGNERIQKFRIPAGQKRRQ
jgi:hypothetical protein